MTKWNVKEGYEAANQCKGTSLENYELSKVYCAYSLGLEKWNSQFVRFSNYLTINKLFCGGFGVPQKGGKQVVTASLQLFMPCNRSHSIMNHRKV